VVRLKQISFVSQVKLILLLAIPTGAMIFLLFLMLALAGLFSNRAQDDAPFLMIAVILAVFSGIFAIAIAVIQIAALGLLRFLPWRGPEMKVEEPRNLSGIFE
jgi:type IV secretory pathway VirB2 component (pilin)